MKSLRDVVEALNARFYIDNFKEVSAEGLAQQYLSEFWKVLGEYCTEHGGFISKNNYRIYLPIPKKWVDMKPMRVDYKPADLDLNGNPFTWHNEMKFNLEDAKILSDTLKFKSKSIKAKIDQAIRDDDDALLFSLEKENIISQICSSIGDSLSHKNIQNVSADLTANLVTYEGHDGRERQIKITKLLSGRKELLEAYNLLLTFTSTPKTDMMLCFSNHKYDIAGKSTDRKWVSCMELYGGNTINLNRELALNQIIEDIRNGAFVAYIISDKDTNINNPFGRISIIPTQNTNNHIIYTPEQTVYTPFAGLSKLHEFVLEVMEDIYDSSGYLYRIDGVFADLYNNGIESDVLYAYTYGKYKGYDVKNSLPTPISRLTDRDLIQNWIKRTYAKDQLKSISMSKAVNCILGCVYAIACGAFVKMDSIVSGATVLPCGKKDLYKILHHYYKNEQNFEKYEKMVKYFISGTYHIDNMWKFNHTKDADKYIKNILDSCGIHYNVDSYADITSYYVFCPPSDFSQLLWNIANGKNIKNIAKNIKDKSQKHRENIKDKLKLKFKEKIHEEYITMSTEMLSSGEFEWEDKTYAISKENFIKVFDYPKDMMQEFLQEYEKLGGTIRYETNEEAEKDTGYPTTW